MQPRQVPLDKIVAALTCLFSISEFEQSPININSQQVYLTSNASLSSCDSSVLNEFPTILKNVNNFKLLQKKYIKNLEEEIAAVKDYIRNIYITAYALPQDCVDQPTGIVKVKIDKNIEPIHVQCEKNKHGANWMLIVQRYDDSRLFKKTYTAAEWANGFGAGAGGEFFIGLKKIHTITANKPQELLVIFEDEQGVEHYQHYGSYRIKSDSDAYKLDIMGEYTGDKTESLLSSQSNLKLTGTLKLYLRPKK